MIYFLPYSFQKFSRAQKWDIGSIWVKANIFLFTKYLLPNCVTKYMSQRYQQKKQFTIIKNLKKANIFTH